MMRFSIQLARETDGRWIAEVPELPGTLVYGTTTDDAVAKVKALALRVVADRLDHGEAAPDLEGVSFAAA
jgi:predicted RNase H-like HicB family nuclease